MNKYVRLAISFVLPFASTIVGFNHSLRAQSAKQQAASTGLTATVIAGMPDIKPNARGMLSLSREGLTFKSESSYARIALDTISAVSVGDERWEPGGLPGALVRKAIPYGGGAALGVIQAKTVDIMAVEYRDSHDGYHGAVFVLPRKQAVDLQRRLMVGISPQPTTSAVSCEAESTPNSVLLAPITLSGSKLPPEYRVLLYEQLMTELRQANPTYSYFRAGDRSAGSGCTAMTLSVNVSAFNKGNAELRGCTGPLGLFLGTTSMSYSVNLTNQSEKVLFQANMKEKHHLDTQSLGLAQEVARRVTKRMNKEMKVNS
jgi:hypothetical protein